MRCNIVFCVLWIVAAQLVPILDTVACLYPNSTWDSFKPKKQNHKSQKDILEPASIWAKAEKGNINWLFSFAYIITMFCCSSKFVYSASCINFSYLSLFITLFVILPAVILDGIVCCQILLHLLYNMIIACDGNPMLA